MTDRWRCFVAVPLGDALRADLAAVIVGWRQDPRTDGLRWADPAGMHLTFAFLGAVQPDEVTRIRQAMDPVAVAHAPMTVSTGRLGAFARPGSARVLWYGVADADGALTDLADALAGALGLRADGPYRPHITLARARRRSVDLRGWIEEASMAAPVGRLEVSVIQLMRSQLGRGPARYETLASFDLGGGS